MEMTDKAAIKEATKQVWGTSPAGWIFGDGHEFGSKEFFEAVLKKRFSYEVPWLDHIVCFKRFNGKKVLEIGCGGGYDAYQFCAAGADYTGIDITPQNPLNASKHISYYGYKARFLELDAEHLNFNEEFDYIYSFGVLHHTPDMQKVLSNCYKALKQGGEVQVIVYNKWSLFYCLTVVLYEWILKFNCRRRSLKEQRSMIESTESNHRPLVNVYSKRELQKLLKQSGFTVIKSDIRKLVQEDLPGPKFIRKLYSLIPESLLNFLGRYIGWYVSVRAVKK